MSGAHHALAWVACIVAIGLPVLIIMAIKRQEDRDEDESSTEVDGATYLRRYRFLWASMPMAFLLLILVALPIAVCGPDGCRTNDVALLLQLVSIVVGLFAWSLMISLIYNRYFHSTATRPFRTVSGAELLMLRSSQVLGVLSIVLMLIGLFGS